jgi:hypothetical protein
MSPRLDAPRESACICGERASIGTERCSCGDAVYPVGGDPWTGASKSEDPA